MKKNLRLLVHDALNLLDIGYTFATNLVYPPTCAACKKWLPRRTVFCPVCYAQIQPIASLPLHLTKKWTIPVLAIADYRAPIKQLILAKSWSNIAATRQLAELIWYETTLRYHPFDHLVPIPLHWTRYARRGYNQAHEIAHYLSRKSGTSVSNLLKRHRYTPFQSSCSKEGRSENVRGAFALTDASAKLYTGKNLVLVDDLMTTGATLTAAARELTKLKPASITAVVACRVI